MKKIPKSIASFYKHAYTCTYIHMYMFTHIRTERDSWFSIILSSFVCTSLHHSNIEVHYPQKKKIISEPQEETGKEIPQE